MPSPLVSENFIQLSLTASEFFLSSRFDRPTGTPRPYERHKMRCHKTELLIMRRVAVLASQTAASTWKSSGRVVTSGRCRLLARDIKLREKVRRPN